MRSGRSLGKYKSTLSRARETTISLRTTVPSEVVKALSLAPGDKVEWDIRLEDGKVYVVVLKGS